MSEQQKSAAPRPVPNPLAQIQQRYMTLCMQLGDISYKLVSAKRVVSDLERQHTELSKKCDELNAEAAQVSAAGSQPVKEADDGSAEKGTV